MEKIIKENNLECSLKEFEKYLNSLDLGEFEEELNKTEVKKYTFDELYNWEKIDNPIGSKYYYVIEFWEKILQTSVPFVDGLVALDDENIDETIKNHKEKIISNYVNNERIKRSIEYFVNKKNQTNEEEKIITKYKNVLNEIFAINSEIDELEKNIEAENVEWDMLKITEARIEKLKSDRTAKRNELNEISVEWVTKFWTQILSKF